VPTKTPPLSPAAAAPSRPTLLPLGALAAGFGLALSPAMAQQTASPAAPAASAAAPAASAGNSVTTLPEIKVKATAEPTGKQAYQATTTRIGKGKQELRDVPQSVTVVTERLIDDRAIDTLKQALHQTAGISFLAAEGGEEDIRLRGFSLQAAGDIFIDGMRDPAFYERDSFNWDRLELLRGSASMLFGRGSTGGAVNQVSKQPMLSNDYEVSTTLGSGNYMRSTLDMNQRTGETTAVRINTMLTQADNYGNRIDNKGIAPTIKYGIGTPDEVSVGLYHLENNGGINYGLPWVPLGASGNGDRLWTTDPKNYYGLASDYLRGSTTQGNLVHTHKFDENSELRTAFRQARYTRDQRASTIRFRCVPNNLGVLPAGCTDAVTADTLSDATVLNRGTPTPKIMNMDTRYFQTDYSGKFTFGGYSHTLLGGMDYSDESFENFGLSPFSPTLIKPTTTVGSPNDGASVDEGSRITRVTQTFRAKALGVYIQDLVQVAPAWKVLGGLRWDHFAGRYAQPELRDASNAVTQPAAVRERTDALWSHRFGILFQPTATQSYHFSYGTSFNTSGDTYRYDALGSNTGPEGSRNFELGAKIDTADGKFTTRVALFHATKYNERNRDEPTATNYALSGARHAAGLELDLMGRPHPLWEVFGSYSFIPDAKIDKGATDGTTLLAGETVGSRPGLTPRHTGTLWTTYKVLPKWRMGGGLNARSSDRPQQSTITAPRYITGDLMTEFEAEHATFRLNVTNVTDEHYADMLYRGHYIPGKGRTVQLNMTLKF
jgi:catecholate siderophore receptor